MTRLKILVPLDGSKLAEASLSYLSSLRGLGDVELRLVSVVDNPEETKSLSHDEAEARVENILATYLRDVSDGIRHHLGLESETRILHGNPAECLIQAAADFEPDLILITTHGRSGISRWRLGSVADKVIRAVKSNTLVIGPKAAQTAEWFAEISPPFKSVLVPLDGSSLSEEALAVARQFAEHFQSKLHLVRVVAIPIYGDMGAEAMYPDLLTDLVSAAEAHLATIKAQPGMPADTEAEVLIGAAATELESYIANHVVDLVVMTTHGRGGIARAALGSVTDRLLGTGAPILVVKPAEVS